MNVSYLQKLLALGGPKGGPKGGLGDGAPSLRSTWTFPTTCGPNWRIPRAIEPRGGPQDRCYPKP